MLVAAAVCPCPPLLVPEVAAGAAPELDGVRSACAQAVAVLAAARAERLVVVGPETGDGRARYAQGTAGSFHGFGVDLDVRLGVTSVPQTQASAGQHAPGPVLPSSLAVGAWLLAGARWPSAVPVSGLGTGDLLDAGQCAAAGRELTEGPTRVALLVMGDGSACRSKAPGAFDERAAGFDAAVAHALAAADTAALGALDGALARTLKAAGRAPWQVLAGAAEGTDLAGELFYDDAPYGVGYLVAAWS